MNDTRNATNTSKISSWVLAFEWLIELVLGPKRSLFIIMAACSQNPKLPGVYQPIAFKCSLLACVCN